MLDGIEDELLDASHPEVSGQRVRYVLLRKGAQILLNHLKDKGGYTEGWGAGYDALQGGLPKAIETAIYLERKRILAILRHRFPSNKAAYIIGEKTLDGLFNAIENPEK